MHALPMDLTFTIIGANFWFYRYNAGQKVETPKASSRGGRA